MEGTSAAFYLPRERTLEALRDSASRCRGCDRYKDATQTVFGQGLTDAELVLIGEQPGEVEDRKGEPSVGPAGRILDQALESTPQLTAGSARHR